MTYEKFEKARDKYNELNETQNLAIFFNKGEYNETRDMTIAVYGKNKEITETIIIPDVIRQKINTMLWEEANKLEEEFAKI